MSILEVVSWISIIGGILCALWLAVDVFQHPQKMKIMNVVWPVTGLYAGPLALWAYYRLGKTPKEEHEHWQSTGLAALHCGSGCTLGDLIAEWLLFFFPVMLFGRHLFGTWAVDFGVAFLLGIAFQYFTIKPMKDLTSGEALKEAVKADTLSLTAWQVGMYGWMALAVFVFFGHELEKTNPVFWFMMQIAMLCGFLTAYPVNWWLVRKNIKEAM